MQKLPKVIPDTSLELLEGFLLLARQEVFRTLLGK